MSKTGTSTRLVRYAIGIGVLCAALAVPAAALTVEHQIDSAYVKAHPDDFTVQVSPLKEGLLHFTVVRNLKAPRYLVAHLVVRHDGKVIAQSDTPLYGRSRDNTFYVALAPEDVNAATFEIGESYFVEANGQAVSIPGTIEYQFRLSDFVPKP